MRESGRGGGVCKREWKRRGGALFHFVKCFTDFLAIKHFTNQKMFYKFDYILQ